MKMRREGCFHCWPSGAFKLRCERHSSRCQRNGPKNSKPEALRSLHLDYTSFKVQYRACYRRLVLRIYTITLPSLPENLKLEKGAPPAQNYQMGDAEGEHHFAKVTLGTRSGTVCWLIFKFMIQIRAWWLRL